jgi:3-oxoacyl-[acyl-carrier protein] reductase
MDLALRGARALVTGGSRGIGFAVADALAAEGAAVGIVARGADGLAAAAARLAGYGVPVATAAADVTDMAALEAAVRQIAGELGGLDHLVANAGGTVGGNLTDSAPGDFLATFALNAGHAAELIRSGLPYLKDSQAPSCVIISSITGMRPAPRTTYAVAKAAEIQLAATAAAELASAGIRVNAVSPGSRREPGRLRRIPRQPVPAGTARPPGRGGGRGRVPAVAAGVLDHRGQHRRGRGPGVPQRPPLRRIIPFVSAARPRERACLPHSR